MNIEEIHNLAKHLEMEVQFTPSFNLDHYNGGSVNPPEERYFDNPDEAHSYLRSEVGGYVSGKITAVLNFDEITIHSVDGYGYVNWRGIESK